MLLLDLLHFTFELLYRNVCPVDFQLIAVLYLNHIQLKEDKDFCSHLSLLNFDDLQLLLLV